MILEGFEGSNLFFQISFPNPGTFPFFDLFQKCLRVQVTFSQTLFPSPETSHFLFVYLFSKVLEIIIYLFPGLVSQSWDFPKLNIYIFLFFSKMLQNSICLSPGLVSQPGDLPKINLFDFFRIFKDFEGSSLPLPRSCLPALGPPKNQSFYLF